MTSVYICLSLFYLVTIGLLFIGLKSYFKAKTAQSWPSASASINQCRLIKNINPDSYSARVSVEYEYSVKDSNYTGDCIAFGYTGDSNIKAQEVLYHKLSRAKTILVRYDPADPSISVIAAGMPRSAIAMLIGAGMAFVMAIGFMILVSQSTQKNPRILQDIIVIEKKDETR